jgi:hypothetical protein
MPVIATTFDFSTCAGLLSIRGRLAPA